MTQQRRCSFRLLPPCFPHCRAVSGRIGRISGIGSGCSHRYAYRTAAFTGGLIHFGRQGQDIEETVPQTFTDTLLDIPNVDVESSSSVMFSRIRIRGSEPNQITYRWTAFGRTTPQPPAINLSGIFIDPELLKQVEVKRGGGSSLYGNGGIGEHFL